MTVNANVSLESKINYVFILDDEKIRHDGFRHLFRNQGFETIHATSVNGAIEELEKHVSGVRKLSYITLDHDLNDYGPNPYDPNGKWKEYTGRDVVDWIVHNFKPEDVVPMRVHSWNIVAGTGMVKALQDAGFQVEHRPFKMTPDGDFKKAAKP